MSKLSRRTLVAAAAALPALSVPALAAAEPASTAVPACTLPPDLIERFVRARAWYLDYRKREDAEVLEDDETETDLLCNERLSVAKAMMAHKPQTVVDLAWQAEAYLIADLEMLSSTGSCTSDRLIRTLFHHIRTFGALPQPDDPLGELSIDIESNDGAEA